MFKDVSPDTLTKDNTMIDFLEKESSTQDTSLRRKQMNIVQVIFVYVDKVSKIRVQYGPEFVIHLDKSF